MRGNEFVHKMRIYRIVSVFLFILIYLQYSRIEYVDASYWDGVGGVSQLKSLAQFIVGRKKAAIQTQKIF